MKKVLNVKGAWAHKKVWMSWSVFVNFERCQSMIKWIEVCLKKRSFKRKSLDKAEVYYESGLILKNKEDFERRWEGFEN